VGLRRAPRADGDAGVRLERDDRLLVLAGPGLVVMAPPAYLSLLLPRRAAPADGEEGARQQREQDARWRELIARIDAEDSALPEDAVVMATVANLVGPRRPRGLVVPEGITLPVYATAVIGTTPTPFITANFEFERAAGARRWEEQWPGLRQQVLASPLLLLSGMSGIVARIEVTRDGSTLTGRTTAATQEEMRRVLRTIANLLPGGGAR
jgi:hypothetical protein